MSSIVITKSPLSGSVNIPSSKSFAHRALICAALGAGRSVIKGITDSHDISATFGALKALGANITKDGTTYIADGFSVSDKKEIFCNESGSTLRFMLPIAAALGAGSSFTGSGRLPERPLDTLTDLLKKHSVSCTDNKIPMKISGRLSGGEFLLPGNVSSQYISGLLMAAPLTGEDVKITLTSPLESKGYVDITIAVMKAFGVEVTPLDNGWFVKKGQHYTACDYTVEGDWSQAAFFMVAGAIGSDIEITGLNPNSCQGDMEVLNILRRMGADITLGDTLKVKKSSLVATNIDAGQIPDAVPALSIAAAFAKGTTVISGAGRLRIKESDRLSAVANGLKTMGILVNELPDGLKITGGTLKSGMVDGENDHRIVMAFSVAAANTCGKTTITDCESVNKSYPDFFKDFKSLKGVSEYV